MIALNHQELQFLCLVFSESLDKVQSLVEDKFQEIRNSDRSCFVFRGQPCTSEHLQVYSTVMVPIHSHCVMFVTILNKASKTYAIRFKVLRDIFLAFFFLYFKCQILVRAVPIKQGHKLRIIWPIPPSIRLYKEGPCRYLGHLIGHEGEGSLFYVLKTLGGLHMLFICFRQLNLEKKKKSQNACLSKTWDESS